MLAVLAASAACVKKTAPGSSDGPRGQLMVAFSTNLEPGKDLDRIEVEVRHRGASKVVESWTLGAGRTLMPVTLALVAQGTDEDPVTVVGRGFRDGRLRVVREATTSIPTGRAALLRMPLDGLCADRPAPCPGGATCAAGACVPSALELASLPDYQPPDVFGAPCFPVLECFGSVPPSNLDLTTCSVARPSAGAAVAVALRSKAQPADGTCDERGCFVPLDEHPVEGWTVRGGSGSVADARVGLPPAVCDRVRSLANVDVIVTPSCGAKGLNRPTCGPWSSVAQTPASDAGSATPTLVAPVAKGEVLALAADANRAYYATATTIRGVPLGGGAVSDVVAGVISPTQLRTDGQDVFWVGNKGLFRAPTSGGRAQVLAAPVDSMDIDATDAFWVTSYCTNTDCREATWTLSSIAKSGGDTNVIASETKTRANFPDLKAPATGIVAVSGDTVAFYFLPNSPMGADLKVVRAGASARVIACSQCRGPLELPEARGVVTALGGTVWFAYGGPGLSPTSGQVQRLKSDSAFTELVDSGLPLGLTHDSRFAYWINSTERGYEVRRQSPDGPNVDTIAVLDHFPKLLSFGGGNLIWLDDQGGRIMRLELR